MVFPALLSPHSQLQRERPVSCAIRIWRTTMFIGHGRKSATTKLDNGFRPPGRTCMLQSNSAGAQCADEKRFVAAEYRKDRV